MSRRFDWEEPKRKDTAWKPMFDLAQAQLLRDSNEALAHGFFPPMFQHLKLSTDLFCSFMAAVDSVGPDEARRWLDSTLQRMAVMLDEIAGRKITITIKITHKEA